MFEVEAKVAISKSEYKQLQKVLNKSAKCLESLKNDDTYYGDPKNVFLRLRCRGGEYEFNLKRRQTIRGIESNIEMEWGIKDERVWKKLLKKLTVLPTGRKYKESQRYAKDGFTIELNRVRRLGYYLEIERLVKRKEDVRKAKKKLLELFKKLGYERNRFETRPYLELLSYV